MQKYFQQQLRGRLSMLSRRDYVTAAIALLVLLVSSQVGTWLFIVTAAAVAVYYYRNPPEKVFAVSRSDREQLIRFVHADVKEILKELHTSNDLSATCLQSFTHTAQAVTFMLGKMCSHPSFPEENMWSHVMWAATTLIQSGDGLLNQQSQRNACENLARVLAYAKGVNSIYGYGRDPAVGRAELRRLRAPISLFRYWHGAAPVGDNFQNPTIDYLRPGDWATVNNKWLFVKEDPLVYHADKDDLLAFMVRYRTICIDDGLEYYVIGGTQSFGEWYITQEVAMADVGGKLVNTHRALAQGQLKVFGENFFLRGQKQVGVGVDEFEAVDNFGEMLFGKSPESQRGIFSFKPEGQELRIFAGEKVYEFNFKSYAAGQLRG